MNPNANRIAPVVLVPACQRELGRHPFHVAGKKYLDAIRLAGCVPLVVPAAQLEELPTLMALAQGHADGGEGPAVALRVKRELGVVHRLAKVAGVHVGR
jgi:hypothetical protein